MTRINTLDNLKGLAFMFMIIQHIFYIYDVSNDYKTKLSKNILIDSSGTVARTLFILIAGYSLYLAHEKDKKDKKKFIKKRLKRSLIILIHGILVTLITYILYPKYFIRFGILHFMSLGTLILSLIVPYKKLLILIFLLLVSIKIPKINPLIDTITGAEVHYIMMDWFPLNSWLPYLILGILCGPLIKLTSDETILPTNIKVSKKNIIKEILEKENILTVLGKNSLNFYTLHLIILLIFFKLKNIN